MALCLNSLVTRQLGKLSLGITQTSVRLSSSKRKRKANQRVEPVFEPRHGERIWIFNHFLDGMTVYSNKPVLKANRALKQLPFNGKKMKPSKLRKDYWRPLAMIQLPGGYGEVGRNVYQRLRECKTLHELSWGDETLYDDETGKTLTRAQRGQRLNNQKPNTVADVAAVLGGLGKGNKMRPESVLPDAATDEEVDAAAGRPAKAARASDLQDGLLKATVFWANALDKDFAEKWPANVTHETFENSEWQPLEGGEDVEEGSAEEGQDGDGRESQKAPSDIVANEELHKVSEEARRPSP